MKRLTEAAEFWVADCGGDAQRALSELRETMAQWGVPGTCDLASFERLAAELEAYLRGTEGE